MSSEPKTIEQLLRSAGVFSKRLIAILQAHVDQHAAAARAQEREKWEALDDDNADTIEGIDEVLPHWNHVHASGEEEEQNLIERAETTANEWRREKAQREKSEAALAAVTKERDAALAELHELRKCER